MSKETAVFLSSTWEDLEEHRRLVLHTLAKFKRQVTGMEYFGARHGEPLEVCLSEVRKSGVYIGIVGTRYGSLAKDGKSFTELEYEEALNHNKNILIYVIDEQTHPVLPKHVDKGENAVRLSIFKEKLLSKHVCRSFSSPDNLASQIGIDLINIFEDIGENVRAALKDDFSHLLFDARTDVDGLIANMSNTLDGKTFPVHLLTKTSFKKDQDPPHDGEFVDEQLSKNNGGFVSAYAKTHKGDTGDGLVMGFYNGSSLPVYDHLARNFCICDRWFCSVRGATWPNRLYAVTGRAAGSRDNKKIPIYDLPSFVRHLDAKKVAWRWYTHDFATLRLTDGKFRVGRFKNFAFFDRGIDLGDTSFLEDASSGNLAPVSWIDPFFGHLNRPRQNDDHPPADVMAGQELVLKLYNAVVTGPKWKKTLLVIVYDEHGGFFDHVPPPPAEDDSPGFRHYGVRVPAFVISPFVERGKVSSMVFDHTSLIKTILLRFCRRPDGSIPDMGARVRNANHLGHLLTLDDARAATPVSSFQHLIERVAQWRAETFKDSMMQLALSEPEAPPPPSEVQEGMEAAKRYLRKRVLPEGQP